jgi:hypothetical protein
MVVVQEMIRILSDYKNVFEGNYWEDLYSYNVIRLEFLYKTDKQNTDQLKTGLLHYASWIQRNKM